MNSLVVALIFAAFAYTTAQTDVCSGNPCDLGGVYSIQNGYQCIPKDSLTALCTCPGGVEQNKPCRLCNRTNPGENVCRNATGKLIVCLDTNAYGTSFACLCSNLMGGTALTTDADCDTTVTLTTPKTTTTASLGPSSLCLNGGVFVDGICNCPSGYSGALCADKNDINLCERIVCQNNGTCAIRNYNGPYEGVCLCRYGTWGDFCELNGTLGYCSAGSCLNGGACKENVVGITRHAYCQCPAGYNGVKCDNRYFVCPAVGRYSDPVMRSQGKYFDCTNVGGTLQIKQLTCPKGLRFNENRNVCTYAATK